MSPISICRVRNSTPILVENDCMDFFVKILWERIVFPAIGSLQNTNLKREVAIWKLHTIRLFDCGKRFCERIGLKNTFSTRLDW
jgi:hypothetical protein